MDFPLDIMGDCKVYIMRTKGREVTAIHHYTALALRN